MARKCFYSFHYKPDCHRAAQVRNIGTIEGNSPASDNGWETVTKAGDIAIAKWIASEMSGRSCTIVLVGAATANRKWINHEIIESWNKGMGVVGIRVHGLKNLQSELSIAGPNPFDYINHKPTSSKLSSIVKLYNPPGTDSKMRYNWIAANLSNAVEEAVKIRKQYS